MKKLEFTNRSASRIYNNYMSAIEKHLRVLSKEDAQDLIMEFNSHIYEGILSSDIEDEVEKLLNVIEKLGNPSEILAPIVADKKLHQATRTFNPKQVLQALRLKIRYSLTMGFIGVLYLLLFVFTLFIPLKIFAPDNTGLFYKQGSFGNFGFINNPEDYQELLGYWLIPAVLAIAILMYFGITMLLRLWRK